MKECVLLQREGSSPEQGTHARCGHARTLSVRTCALTCARACVIRVPRAFVSSNRSLSLCSRSSRPAQLMLSRTLLVLANGPGSDQTHEHTFMEVSRPGNPKPMPLKVSVCLVFAPVRVEAGAGGARSLALDARRGMFNVFSIEFVLCGGTLDPLRWMYDALCVTLVCHMGTVVGKPRLPGGKKERERKDSPLDVWYVQRGNIHSHANAISCRWAEPSGVHAWRLRWNMFGLSTICTRTHPALG